MDTRNDFAFRRENQNTQQRCGAALAPSGGHTGSKETLVQKLQGALEGLRRDRDHAHRAKELAHERLRLALEEEQVLKRTVDAMKEKSIKTLETSTNTQSKLGPLEAEVKVMNQTMKFQHSELLGAREKIEQMKRAMQDSSKQREKNLHCGRQLLHERRLKLRSLEKSLEEAMDDQEQTNCCAAQKDGLARELNAGMVFDSFWDGLPKLVQEKAVAMSIVAQEIHSKSAEIAEDLTKYGIELESTPDTDSDSFLVLQENINKTASINEAAFPPIGVTESPMNTS